MERLRCIHYLEIDNKCSDNGYATTIDGGYALCESHFRNRLERLKPIDEKWEKMDREERERRGKERKG